MENILKILIVEDEDNVKISTEAKLMQYCENVSIVGWAKDVTSAVDFIKNNNPDLVLLDIKLPDGTGFDVLKKVYPIQCNVVFTTAFNQFAVEAFRFSAIDYLLKPISVEDLVSAVNKSRNKTEIKHINEKLSVLQQNMEAKNKDTKRIVLNSSTTIRIVSVSEIIYCQAEANYTRFVFTDNSSLLTTTTLGIYEDMLTTYGFFRSHKSYLINMTYLKELNKINYELKMDNGDLIPLSQRKKDELISLLNLL